jgi:hypothetical protein
MDLIKKIENLQINFKIILIKKNLGEWIRENDKER